MENKIQIPQFARQMLSNKEMEAAVLNGLMNEREGIDQAMQRLNDYCFYEPAHQVIYHAICNVYGANTPISMISVTNELMHGMDYEKAKDCMLQVAQIATQVEEKMDFYQMVLVLENIAQRRALAPVGYQLLELSYTLGTELNAGVNAIQLAIDQIMAGTKGKDFTSLTEQLEIARQHIIDNRNPETQHIGLMTGIPQFDREGGLPDNAFIVVGAKSSHGKTSFANYLALQAMKRGKRVAYYSMEMTNLELTQRLLSMECRVNVNALARLKLDPAQEVRAFHTIDMMIANNAENFSFDERGVNHLDRMLQSIRVLKRTRGLDLVVVDYIQLLGIDPVFRDENVTKMIGRAAHAFKDISRDLGVTIVCLSQINRNVTGRPTRANLRDSGEIDEASDLTIILYRPEADKVESYSDPYQHVSVKNTMLVDVSKFRSGGQMEFFMGYQPEYTLPFVLTKEAQGQMEIFDQDGDPLGHQDPLGPPA
jgi:replicative DNA helicase